jgi:phosphoribosyl 1,2-cyclic phosphodiesterase
VEIVCGGEGDEQATRIVLDAGTGLRALGNDWMAKRGMNKNPTRAFPTNMTLLLSHYHWDHIQGLPFFVPMYMKDTSITIVGGQNGVMSVREALERQMSAPSFPVRFDEVGARIGTREVKLGEGFHIGDATVRVGKGNHPGGVVAYRVDYNGKSVVYATDTEHYSCVDPALRSLCEGADVLIYDSQYTPEEYKGKVGWGHSTYVAGAELAKAAGVGTYVLYHHDPMRTDDGVLAIEKNARELFSSSIAAREGLEIDLARQSSPSSRRFAA